MKLTTLAKYIKQDYILTDESEYVLAIKIIDQIIEYSNDPEFWPWKGRDHVLLIRHYDKIIDKLESKQPSAMCIFPTSFLDVVLPLLDKRGVMRPPYNGIYEE
jgi:hypothetical protein